MQIDSRELAPIESLSSAGLTTSDNDACVHFTWHSLTLLTQRDRSDAEIECLVASILSPFCPDFLVPRAHKQVKNPSVALSLSGLASSSLIGR